MLYSMIWYANNHQKLPILYQIGWMRNLYTWPFLWLWWSWDQVKCTHKFPLYIWMKTMILIYLSNIVLHDLKGPSTTRNFPFFSKVAGWEICACPFLWLWWTWDLLQHTHKLALYIWMKTVIFIFLSNAVLHDLVGQQPQETSNFVSNWLN